MEDCVASYLYRFDIVYQ